MKTISFTISLPRYKSITFSTETQGLIVNGKEYLALDDGILIYDKTKGLQANKVMCQFSSNTSTLIPALRIIGIQYHPYFDRQDVVASQNDISFYWKPSKLAAYYNGFSTDRVELTKREPIIRKAVEFLISTAKAGDYFLPEEMLEKIKEPVKLLGFYQGFPIFDNHYGFAKLLSRLGIHVDENEVMVSTPLDEHAKTVEALAKHLEAKLKVKPIYKKNRVVFPTSPELLKELGLPT